MFQFKQFLVNQDRCAMKIGTDGVLLGAWCPIDNNPFSVLDIGAGTGILSLMLAQKSNASQIDAIEIDEDAYEQCVANFENSPWGDRLFCFHAGLDEFIDEPEDQYDIIISNPPFYSENYKTGSDSVVDLLLWFDYTKFPEKVSSSEEYVRELKKRSYFGANEQAYLKAINFFLN